MATSNPGVELRSNPTLDCFTDAILLREGPGAVGATYVLGISTTAPASAPSSMPSSLGAPSSSLATPTSLGMPPSFGPGAPLAPASVFPASPPPVVIVRRGAAMDRVKHFTALRTLDEQLREARDARRQLATTAALQARSACWSMVAGVGVGAAAAVAAMVSARDGVRASLLFAIFACIAAGVATLAMGAVRIGLRD